jgi:hypothetical protein
MGQYTKLTDFTSKDTLPSGSTNKIIRGSEIDTEFSRIQTAVNSKADTADLDSAINNINTLNLWTIEEVSGVLYFKVNGVSKASLDASGNLVVVGDITAFGTI